MIDRSAVARYDRTWKAPRAATVAVERKRYGLLKTATVVRASESPPRFTEELDVVVAGGGPVGTLHAALLARRGYSVLLLERSLSHRSGSTWNIDRSEYEALKATRVLDESEVEQLRVGEFEQGIFRLWDDRIRGHQEFRFEGVLTVSLDETRYFDLLGQVPGLRVQLGSVAELERQTTEGVFVRVDSAGRRRTIKARLLIDARGWTSPLSALVNAEREEESWYNMVGVRCRTPKARFQRTDQPATGLICCTFEGAAGIEEGGVMPIWGRFADSLPENGGGTGDLLYYYTRTAAPVPLAPMLDELVQGVARLLPSFEEQRVERTYFGHAAGYYPPPLFSRRVHQVSAGDRVLLVGVAGQQYNGLTGCAVGALVRNATRISQRIDRALRADDLGFEALQAIDIEPRERASQALTGLFAGGMKISSSRSSTSSGSDWLTFAKALDRLDAKAKSSLLKDRLSFSALNALLLGLVLDPRVLVAVLRVNSGRKCRVVSTLARSYVALAVCDLRAAWRRLQPERQGDARNRAARISWQGARRAWSRFAARVGRSAAGS